MKINESVVINTAVIFGVRDALATMKDVKPENVEWHIAGSVIQCLNDVLVMETPETDHKVINPEAPVVPSKQ